ncbi:FKBP-type peptidyl-prolyl cis-trans isomerase [Antribacter gilvus]|uniref:FKBP-type peptidyl-prolyl cis-trans isomerase n=1 Tax=Antribacter gilvus TaxID=2304675 RepID=UPI000F79C242|nr:FKBP-type peptidyl-prolyl cis-trans isomerase [Antribacter gilvus]
MKHRTTAGLAALALGSALALAGCASDDAPDSEASSGAAVCTPAAAPAEASSSPLPTPSAEDVAAVEAIQVAGDPGSEPTVTFTPPLTVTAPTSRVVNPGTGADLVDGQQVSIRYVAIAGADGKKVFSKWDEGQEPETFTFGDPNFQLLNVPLEGQKVGTRLLLASQGQDGAFQVSLIEVEGAKDVAERAEGEPVKPEEGLPTVELAEDGAPTVTIPEGYEAPTELVSQTLIEGSGAEVSADQTVTVQYAGCLLDGTSFDSSWSRGAPMAQPLDQLIKGWAEGLSGQKIGSQVLLVIPPELGYGDQESGSIPANSPLVFVVDILDATGGA